MCRSSCPETARASIFSFFFNDTATTEIYTLSLHTLFRSPPDPGRVGSAHRVRAPRAVVHDEGSLRRAPRDRKSTRLNSSHLVMSNAVFFLEKTQSCLRTYDELIFCSS